MKIKPKGEFLIKKQRIRVNERIYADEVRLISQNKEQIGVVSVKEALIKAQEAGLDLVEISPNAKPPVCKIMDFGKFKYEEKKKAQQTNTNEANSAFELELTASVLAYEIARSDGNISDDELLILMNEIEIIAEKVGKEKHEIFKIIEIYSNDSTSFHEFIEDINKNYNMDEKLSLIEFMWKVAFADGKLDVDEEKLIRRMASLIKIKDIEVLKLKNFFRN